MLQGKKILLGITGSIAAYKTPHLVRLLVKAGAEVKVVATTSALDFVSPVALGTVANNAIVSDFYKNKKSGTWENHVELGLWPDLFLVAPLSANTLAKMASGEANNVLLTTWLSKRCSAVVCPAMDVDMFHHASTQSNLRLLKEQGVEVLDSPSGELASGLVGKGRMLEPEKIVSALEDHFNLRSQLKGKSILITAGPTYEHIDPVRFIGNHSSGKMGFALANECANRGADVTLVAGPVSEEIHHPKVNRIDVVSAQEMFNACTANYENSDVAILSAAVSDYRPVEKVNQKIKKSEETMTIELIKNPDILKTLGNLKTENQKLVGFALETNNELENAKKKLISKNLDFIVLNSLQDKGAGFGTETNKIQIVNKDNNPTKFELKSKSEVAKDIINYLYSIL
jgi:phosphopantothenoylcysteine decarboxylase/phosphopantothenate--cysteine ligase